LKAAELGRSRGGLTSKIHVAADRRCRPLAFVLTPGQAGDSPQFAPVLERVKVRGPVGRPRTRPDAVAADKAIAFRFLAAGQAPDFRSISRFRRRHLDALADLFTQSLHLATKLGMVKMGRVALDGTKLEANASKHKAMSYGRLISKEEQIEAEVAALEAQAAALLADAEATDTAEDQVFGTDGKDTDLPAELDRREKRLAKLQAARAQIEAEARPQGPPPRRGQGTSAARSARAPATSRPSPTPATRPPPRPVPSRKPRPTSPTPTRGS
jgi:hypothetical protein